MELLNEWLTQEPRGTVRRILEVSSQNEEGEVDGLYHVTAVEYGGNADVLHIGQASDEDLSTAITEAVRVFCRTFSSGI